MKQGFINVLLILLIVVIAGGAGYIFFVKQAASPTAENQTSATSGGQTPPPANEPNLDFKTPTGGELSLKEAVTINYKVSDGFKAKLSEDIKTELYLLNEKNVLFGYIGKFDPASTFYVWNPAKLQHNGGMDMSVAPTPPGKYRILIVARPAYEPKCLPDCPEIAVDTLDSELTTYVDGKIYFKDQSRNGLETLIETQPLGSDASSELFTLK